MPDLGLLGGIGAVLMAGTMAMSSRVRSRVRSVGDHVIGGLPFNIQPLSEQEKRVINSQRRQRIWEIVTEQPGLSQSGIADRMEVNRSTVKEYLDILEREEIVETVRVGRSMRYVPRGLENKKSFALLQEPKFRNVIRIIVEASNKASNSELADQLDVSTSAMSKRIRTLEDEGLVTTEYHGRESEVSVTTHGVIIYWKTGHNS